jgi:hypothetical protein
MLLRMSEFKCGNGRGDIARVHAIEVYEELRLELVKSYPRSKMRLGDHIHAHSHISPEGRVLGSRWMRGLVDLRVGVDA